MPETSESLLVKLSNAKVDNLVAGGVHSLAGRLRNRIEAHGPISFSEFMEAALYDPAEGYYSAGKARIGRHGDFFTSVSVGPLLGRLLALRFTEMWKSMGRPAPFTIMEQGAHDGTLAADVLAGLTPEFASAVEYVIVETAAHWRTKQRERLAKFPRVRWVETAEQFEGVFFANELIDAFPVERVRWDGAGWRLRRVEWREGFRFCDGEVCGFGLPETLPIGYETEVRPRATAWMHETARALRRGSMLLIDYGYERADYYSPERAGGTLSGYGAQQRADDVLARPGEVDLTAHVDFTALIEAGERAGLALGGLWEQGRFLAGLGARYFTERTPDPGELRAFKTLMHPELLGAAFKVLLMSRGLPP